MPAVRSLQEHGVWLLSTSSFRCRDRGLVCHSELLVQLNPGWHILHSLRHLRMAAVLSHVADLTQREACYKYPILPQAVTSMKPKPLPGDVVLGGTCVPAYPRRHNPQLLPAYLMQLSSNRMTEGAGGAPGGRLGRATLQAGDQNPPASCTYLAGRYSAPQSLARQRHLTPSPGPVAESAQQEHVVAQEGSRARAAGPAGAERGRRATAAALWV